MESTRAVFNHEYGPMADAACSFCIICSHRLMLRTGGCQWKSFASTGKRDPAGRFLLPDGYGPEHHFRCYEHRQLLPRRNVDGGHVHHLCSVYLLWGGPLCSPSHRCSAHVRSGCADPVHSDHPFAQDQRALRTCCSSPSVWACCSPTALWSSLVPPIIRSLPLIRRPISRLARSPLRCRVWSAS